jgi:hypothetical protein
VTAAIGRTAGQGSGIVVVVVVAGGLLLASVASAVGAAPGVLSLVATLAVAGERPGAIAAMAGGGVMPGAVEGGLLGDGHGVVELGIAEQQ